MHSGLHMVCAWFTWHFRDSAPLAPGRRFRASPGHHLPWQRPAQQARREEACPLLNSIRLNTIFNTSGHVKSVARYLGATGEHAGECLLRNFIPEGYSQSIFPYSDTEAAGKPLVKGKYIPALHLAIGCLRVFIAEQNSADPQGDPVCNFHSHTSVFIKGAACLDAYES